MSEKPGIRLIVNLKFEMESIGPRLSCIEWVWLAALSAESILIGRVLYGACSIEFWSAIHITGGKILLANLSLPPPIGLFWAAARLQVV